MVTTRASSSKSTPIRTTRLRPKTESPKTNSMVRTRASTARKHQTSDPSDPAGIHAKGTTAVAFTFNNERVIVAVDHSKVSSGKYPESVLLLNSHLLATISGGSEASRTYLLHDLPQKCSELELKEGRKASAAEASEWLADYLRSHPDSDRDLSLGILIAGWDSELGPSLYKVVGNGERFEKTTVGTGSGRVGFVLIESRKIQSVDKAVEEAKKAICLGVYNSREHREWVSVFQVESAGVAVVVSNDNIAKLQKEFFRVKGLKWVNPRSRIRP